MANNPPPITTGAFVSWGGRSGRVNMIVTSGKVPGVDGDVEGTTSSPAARVTLWQKTSGTWRPTREMAAGKVAVMKRIAPLNKTPTETKAVTARLVAMHANHVAMAEETELPAHCVPDADAVTEVYRRGLEACPETKEDPRQWALARVAAFLDVAAGADPGQYRRDADLLPAGHPMAQIH